MTDDTAAPSAPLDGSVEPPARKLGGVKVVGVLGIIAGILLIIVGLVAWIAVSTQLRQENITVSDDAMAFAGAQVAGPFTAYAQAEVIQKHALEVKEIDYHGA